MYPISNAVKALFEAEQRQTLRITGVDRNGTAIGITEANTMEGGFSIDRYSCNGKKIEIGTAIAAEMTLILDNRQGQFNGVAFEGAELFVEVGIADWTQTNPSVTYIPCGYFTCYEQPRTLSTITLHALDRMMMFDAVPPTLTPWTDGSGNIMEDGNGNIIYFAAELSFPTTVAQLVQQICVRCQVTLAESISGLPNAGVSIAALPQLQQPATFRDLIRWCAGIMGTNAWIDWNGELRFTWYGASTGYVCSLTNRFSSDLYENDLTITGVQYTNTQGISIVSGTSAYALDLTGNYLVGSNVATILAAVNTALNGFSYRPFSAVVVNAPYLWPMDSISFVDANNVSNTTVLTNVNFGINGTTAIAGKGETEKTNSGTSPSAMTTEQAFLIEKAAENVKQLDDSLDQEGVFNRLTDNGQAEGIYLADGKLYINGSYIQAGQINADLITAGHLTANRIQGGTLTLGGQDNANGLLWVLNADGERIVVLHNGGIAVSNGVISVANNEGDRRLLLTEASLILASLVPASGSGTPVWQTGFLLSNSIQSDNTMLNMISTKGNVYMWLDDTGEFILRSTANSTPKPRIQFDHTGTTVTGGITTDSISVGNGASGTFTTANGKTVTVTDGIITSIV